MVGQWNVNFQSTYHEKITSTFSLEPSDSLKLHFHNYRHLLPAGI
jgi:hypothetical protein